MLRIVKVVNSLFNSTTWLISDANTNRVWLVDCGDISQIIEKTEGKTISGVLLTHAHFDHIYGLPDLITLFPDSIIYTNKAGKEALANARLNMSLYYGTPITVNDKQVCLCYEGDEVQLFPNVKAQVLETPGHHPSCLSFIIGDCLFSGDAYIPGERIITSMPGGNKELAKKSVVRIKSLLSGYHLCAGHSMNVK